MASAPVSVSKVGSGYTVFTQVIPSSTAPTTAEQNSTQTLGPLSKFLKGEPKALGTVQILNGLWMIVMSILSFPNYLYLLWGPLIQILAGSLNVSASRKMNPCVVKAALTLNILGAITTGISIVFICLPFERFVFSGYFYIRWIVPDVILLAFSLLQLAISISLSVFACKATCLKEPVGISTLNIAAMNQTPAGSPPTYSNVSDQLEDRNYF
ncbi:membrane-spanning 4-domains subfamily A member 15-like [Tachysurus fulvidraco]|uniref:membrane-spanning 4-domains subfamily A member 15-like n=1 Tax=Tachysurus fulvidraco TaxID=1234273 RepID=UPI001FEF419B|nr:membrane-spanning 4-domains subfamily A member 15-like [Tachysurus fulvidraco]